MKGEWGTFPPRGPLETAYSFFLETHYIVFVTAKRARPRRLAPPHSLHGAARRVVVQGVAVHGFQTAATDAQASRARKRTRSRWLVAHDGPEGPPGPSRVALCAARALNVNGQPGSLYRCGKRT